MSDLRARIAEIIKGCDEGSIDRHIVELRKMQRRPVEEVYATVLKELAYKVEYLARIVDKHLESGEA